MKKLPNAWQQLIEQTHKTGSMTRLHVGVVRNSGLMTCMLSIHARSVGSVPHRAALMPQHCHHNIRRLTAQHNGLLPHTIPNSIQHKPSRIRHRRCPTLVPHATTTLYDTAANVANKLTSLFPFIVLLTAAAGLVQPSCMAWFKSDFLTVGLALIMLGMGATLTLDVW